MEICILLIIIGLTYLIVTSFILIIENFYISCKTRITLFPLKDTMFHVRLFTIEVCTVVLSCMLSSCVKDVILDAGDKTVVVECVLCDVPLFLQVIVEDCISKI